MREELNDILSFIGATSLTDEEWGSLDVDISDDDETVYAALLAVLVARESVSTTKDRLRYYYLAKGAEVGETDTGSSNIFIGAALAW